MRRVSKLHQHLTKKEDEEKKLCPHAVNGKSMLDMNDPFAIWSAGDRLGEFLDVLPNELPKQGEYDVTKFLPGPLNDKEKFPNGWLDAFNDMKEAQKYGQIHVKLAEYQKDYGDKGLASNIVVPYLIFKRSKGDEGSRLPPVITTEVIIGDPQDAIRIGRMHVKKQPNFNLFFYGSVISTIDPEYWKMQREQLVPAFLPHASLEQIFETTADRAQFCAERLAQLSENGKKEIDLGEFLAFETQAQLQLSLFGESNEIMNDTNEKFRHSMAGSYDPAYVRPHCKEVAQRMDNLDRTGPALKEDVQAGKCPRAKGPLSAMLREMEGVHPRTREGNTLIFKFAGFDTTSSTLQFLFFELGRNPQIQKRLQDEVDQFFEEIGDRKVQYRDLHKLKFTTRCIMETLRLWPAVANGSFRELEFDEYVKGPGGKEVLLKKGTYVRLVNWSRHRNPDLWGPDADVFNPDREFKEQEFYFDEGLKAYNPATERFSPFMHKPRGCIGMNFAQMEMRVIIAQLLRKFSFQWTPEFKQKFNPKTFVGVNYGTMGPQNILLDPMIKGYAGWAPQERVPQGLPMKIIPRNN